MASASTGATGGPVLSTWMGDEHRVDRGID